MIENNEQAAENRVLVLYIINELNIQVSNLHLMDAILGNRFMNYFSLQTAIAELLKNGMLSETTEEGKTYYCISEEGKNAVKLLKNIIPQGILARFDSQKKEIRARIKKDLEINAEYALDEDNNYFARCYVRDGDIHLIDFKILAGNKKFAFEICENWRNHTKEIYSEIIETVLKNRDDSQNN